MKSFFQKATSRILMLIGLLACGVTIAAWTNSTDETFYPQPQHFTNVLQITGQMQLSGQGVVAASGGGQGVASATISKLVSTVTASTGSMSVTLPMPAQVGETHMVGNISSQTVSLYGPSGATINASSANTALSLTTGKATVCVATSKTAGNYVCTN